MTPANDPWVADGRYFERYEDSLSEDERRCELLEREIRRIPRGWGRRQHAARLAQAGELLTQLRTGIRTGMPIQTLASSICMRELRASVIRPLIDLVDELDAAELRVVTAISSKWRFTPKELAKTSAQKLKQQFRSHLDRTGASSIPGLFVGFLHGEFEPTSHTFQLHYHAITTAEKATAFKEGATGRWGYVRTSTDAVPIKRQRLSDPEKQVSYLFKAFWPERAVIEINGKQRRERRGRRIIGIHHTEYLVWLARQTLNDMRVVNGCVLRNDRFCLSRPG